MVIKYCRDGDCMYSDVEQLSQVTDFSFLHTFPEFELELNFMLKDKGKVYIKDSDVWPVLTMLTSQSQT